MTVVVQDEGCTFEESFVAVVVLAGVHGVGPNTFWFSDHFLLVSTFRNRGQSNIHLALPVQISRLRGGLPLFLLIVARLGLDPILSLIHI